MPRKPSGEFDQKKYIQEWSKQNMKSINVSYKAEFVEEFRAACDKLGIKRSEVFRQAMLDTIEKAKSA